MASSAKSSPPTLRLRKSCCSDPEFAAGVVSQTNHVVGTLSGQGQSTCRVDYVPSEEKVAVGEMFYTSGDDRIFPKGFPVGVARVVRPSSPYQEVLIEPAGLERGLEAVLIVLEGVHQAIPEVPPANAPVYLGTRPPANPEEQATQPSGPVGTDADKLLRKYRQIGEAENHKFGEGAPGSTPPDFNLKIPAGEGTDAATRRHGDTANPPASNPIDATKTGVAASPRPRVAASDPANPPHAQ